MAAFQLIRFAPLFLLMAGCSSLISQIINPGGGGGSGTVTSVGATGTAIVDVTVTNPTTTPLIILTLPNQIANCALGNFTGSSAAPSCSSTPQFNGANITGLNFTQIGGSASVAQLPATAMLTVSTATANVILKRVTSNTATDSSLTDNGTTITTSEPITAPTFTGVLAGNATTATTATNLPGGLLGSMPYQSSVGATTMLAGTTSSAIAVLTQTGTGTISAAPQWNATTGTGLIAMSANPTFTGAVTSARFTSNQATGTAPFTITSVTPVANLVVAKHPLEQYCGTAAACSPVAQTNGQVVYGSVALVAGTVTVTGINPAFADALYVCTATSKTGVTTTLQITTQTTTSFVINGTAASTDTVGYICVR